MTEQAAAAPAKRHPTAGKASAKPLRAAPAYTLAATVAATVPAQHADDRPRLLHAGRPRRPALHALPRPLGHRAAADRRLPRRRARPGGRPRREHEAAAPGRDPRGLPRPLPRDLPDRPRRGAADRQRGPGVRGRRPELHRRHPHERHAARVRQQVRHHEEARGAGLEPPEPARRRGGRPAGRHRRGLLDAHPARDGPDHHLLPAARRRADRELPPGPGAPGAARSASARWPGTSTTPPAATSPARWRSPPPPASRPTSCSACSGCRSPSRWRC